MFWRFGGLRAGTTPLQGHLTAEQQAALGRMRSLFPGSAAFHTDHDVLRFLRARDFNLDATRAMYQNHISTVRAILPLPPLSSALGRTQNFQ